MPKDQKTKQKTLCQTQKTPLPQLSKSLHFLFLFQTVVKLFVIIFVVVVFSFAGGGRELKGITFSKLVSTSSQG